MPKVNMPYGMREEQGLRSECEIRVFSDQNVSSQLSHHVSHQLSMNTQTFMKPKTRFWLFCVKSWLILYFLSLRSLASF